MLIIPAIDLLGGKVVRLVEGKRESATVYSDDPAAVARGFVAEGAARLHVVDLDGAFSGKRENNIAVQQILATGARVQLGGGVRDLETCKRLLDEGVHRVVVGTLAASAPDTFLAADPALLARVIVAVDARDGRVFVEGWDRETALDAAVLIGKLARRVAGVLYTDIARDGRGNGPNVVQSARLARAIAPVELIASGGIGSLDDLRALRDAGVPACVVGRALYENKFTLAQAIEAAR
ncbi:MAG TPA: 1-(5-phosphoribosyl)-5-[(5-phosphoribosylamino)methylideneamino]imidazole-4-carboxamide isomerase [Polyangia bacterium]|nr:1-(5-phosphoribosyl)-5-[(5-phosphoribosylamino)methylideneamino]imidazole-4-carboxamide isomerase [Polyangia bacterium]